MLAIDDARSGAIDLQRERRPVRARQPRGRRRRPSRLDAAAEAVDVRTRGERRRNGRHPVVPRPHVVVDERQDRGRGARDAGVARVGRAAAALQHVAHACVTVHVPLHHARRVVRRSVVDDEHFECRGAGLAHQIPQQRIHRGRAVQRRHDHRHVHAKPSAGGGARAAARRNTTTGSRPRTVRRGRPARPPSPNAPRPARRRRRESAARPRWSPPSGDRDPTR